MNSKQKGKVGELELAKVFREAGFEEARRGQQYKGGGDSPDVIGLPGCHVECKRTEYFRLYDALNQAITDAAGTGLLPVVVHRSNRREWVAVLQLSSFLNLLKLVVVELDEAAPK